jgi:hypothetical protein
MVSTSPSSAAVSVRKSTLVGNRIIRRIADLRVNSLVPAINVAETHKTQPMAGVMQMVFLCLLAAVIGLTGLPDESVLQDALQLLLMRDSSPLGPG